MSALVITLVSGGFGVVGTVVGAVLANWLTARGRREQRAQDEAVRARERLADEQQALLAPETIDLPAARQALRSGGVLLPHHTTGGPRIGSAIGGSLLPFSTPVMACVVTGSRVLMADGSWRAVEDVTVGDVVRAHDARTQTVSAGEVEEVRTDDRDDLVTVNGTLTASVNQEVFCNGFYAPAGLLPMGGVMVSETLTAVPVDSLHRHTGPPRTVIGLRLATDLGYYVRGPGPDSAAVLVREVGTGKADLLGSLGIG